MQHQGESPTAEQVAARAGALARSMQQECIGVRVGRLHRLVGRRFEQALRPLELSISQLEVLSALFLVGGAVKPTELAGWLAIERSTMSRNLAVMERRGLIETTETSPTGRSQRVAVTTQGIATLADADVAWREAQDSVRAAVGADAPAVLDSWLTRIA